MGKTLLKMQMSVTIMVLDGKETTREEKKAIVFMCRECGSLLGCKNNFCREAGYNGISRKLPCPPKRI